MLNYKGLHAVRETLTVSEAMIDQQINRLLEQRMKITPVTGRPAQLDDEVVLDYAGEVNGDYFQGGSAEKQTLVLGSGMFIPGFEEQLVGKNIGDSVDVSVTFPEQYHSAELAGKAAVFHCKLHEIRTKEKYKADDTFAKEVGGCESFAAMREEMRRGMQDYMNRQADADLRDALLSQIIDNHNFEVSSEQKEAAIDYEMQMMESQLGNQGLSVELYCQFMGKTKEELREEMANGALRNIQRQMAIDEIAKLEGLEPDVNAISDVIGEICRANNMTIEQLEPHMDAAFQTAVSQSALNNMVLDFIVRHAVVEEVNKQA